MSLGTFMGRSAQCRWEDTRNYAPDDYKAPPIDILSPDRSWIDVRTIQNLTEREWDSLRAERREFVERFDYLRRAYRSEENA